MRIEKLIVVTEMLCNSIFHTDIRSTALYRTVTLPVLCECETWSVKLRPMAEDVREQGFEEEVWTKLGESDRRLEKITHLRAP